MTRGLHREVRQQYRRDGLTMSRSLERIYTPVGLRVACSGDRRKLKIRLSGREAISSDKFAVHLLRMAVINLFVNLGTVTDTVACKRKYVFGEVYRYLPYRIVSVAMEIENLSRPWQKRMRVLEIGRKVEVGLLVHEIYYSQEN